MRRVVVLGMVAAVALAACGSDDSDSKSSSASETGTRVVAVELVDTGVENPAPPDLDLERAVGIN